MELESTDKMAIVYETLKNIETAICRLQERTQNITTVDDFIKNDIEPLKAAIEYFKNQLFSNNC